VSILTRRDRVARYRKPAASVDRPRLNACVNRCAVQAARIETNLPLVSNASRNTEACRQEAS
jgi:hypothetical protein